MSKENLDAASGLEAHPHEPGIGAKICEMHFYANGIDGVSLQIGENTDCLRRKGETVLLCASDVPEAGFPELDYHSGEARILMDAILNPDTEVKEEVLLGEINRQSEAIRVKLSDFLDKNGVGVVHLRNITSLPFLHLPASKAVHDLIEQRQDIGFVLHIHDLPWEGPEGAKYVTGYRKIRQLAETVMVPNFPNTLHVAINSLAARELKNRRGIEAEVIPDGFNFEREVASINEEAFFRDFGFDENDLLVGMMTRVRTNKAIQIALQFVQTLENQRGELERNRDGVGLKKKNFRPESRIFLVLPQSKDLDKEYFEQINKMATAMGVSLRFIGDRVVSDRQYSGQEGIYPFYSIYQAMDLIVYPPISEGFGNQAVEAAWARIPLAMHGYPVAEVDIFPKVGGIIPLGNSGDLRELEGTGMLILDCIVVQQAVNQAMATLLNHDLERNMTDRAYKDFRNLCDINKVTDRYREIYRRIIRR